MKISVEYTVDLSQVNFAYTEENLEQYLDFRLGLTGSLPRQNPFCGRNIPVTPSDYTIL